ncbi:sodium-dependent transporter [Dongshaea marina]|uniref:sodium-dependent transporter n=1 Tax=Dongshaea marina TaxID=2047966 RepID=UPI000D3E6013|nr:sodium-dependent transporter [Dongshaea marina]
MSREQWGSRTGFVLAAIGSAIGLGNIWRFPYQAYENGGGAFLVPYLIAMLTAGIPFMILEFTVGHKYRRSAPKIYSMINRNFEWLGWFQTLVAAVIGIYYIAVIGWSLSYLNFSFTQSWGTDTNAFFFSKYLGVGATSSPSNLGSIQWQVVIPVAIAWAITFATVLTGVKKGLERINKILMPLLFLIVLALVIRVLTLPGALSGIDWLFTPDFSKLSDPKVWAGAYGQIFFSLSIGLTIMLTYSSYLPKKSDINNSAFITVFANCGFSLLAGVMIFGALGFMAHHEGKALSDVVTSGVGLAFVTLPSVINQMPAPYIMGPLLFLTLVFAGISSHISLTEAVVSAIKEKFGWSRRRSVIAYCGVGFVLSMLFVTQGGILLLDLVDHFINNIALLGGALIELVLLGWGLRIATLRDHTNQISDFKLGYWWELCIRYFTLLILGALFLSNFIDELRVNYGGYSNQDILWIGWGMVIVMLVASIAINTRTNSIAQKEATA